MFYHGWENYLNAAFPDDELRPLTCDGLTKDENDPTNIGLNDVLGGYSVTLIDSLDMFPILNDQEGFERNVDRVRKYVSFNISSTVQVFETTIRGLGGLLSAHLYASTPKLGHQIPGYDGFLLHLAYDLAERLLPSFNTTSGIPYPRINLKHGLEGAKVTKQEDPDITETCTSGAGSLVLEFGLLSRLTGDNRFEAAAKRAFFAIWARRSDLDLVAMAIDSKTGQWLAPMTGNGASIDSYYEYALKYYVLFGSSDFLNVYNKLHRALVSHSFDGWMFHNVNFQTSVRVTNWVDSLAAFYPSVMVLGGDLETAIKTHLAYYKIWNTYSALPERWDAIRNYYLERRSRPSSVNLEWYPLRPEFVESNYYLYKATKDPFFMNIGRSVMEDLQKQNKVACGYAGIQDVNTGTLSNRMESFFLSETTKYLYLLFDDEHPLNNEFSNFVFSTEAHPFWFDKSVMLSAAANKFPAIAHIWKGENDNNKALESNGNISRNPNHQKQELLSDEEKEMIREYIAEQNRPFYENLGVSVMWGDWRGRSTKRYQASKIGKLLRSFIFHLRVLNQKVFSFIFSFALNNTEKSNDHIITSNSATSLNELEPITPTDLDSTLDKDASYQRSIMDGKNVRNNSTTVKNYPKLSFSYLNQCEVWNPQKLLGIPSNQTLTLGSGLYSYISSWGEFYRLNGLYIYNKPDHLKDYTEFEYRHGFSDRFTSPDSICEKPRIFKDMEIMILTPRGSRKGTVLSRSIDGNVEVTNLNGMRMTIRKKAKNRLLKNELSPSYSQFKTSRENDKDSESTIHDLYDIKILDGVKIDNNVTVQSLLLSQSDNSVVSITSEGKVKIDKYIIDNMNVLKVK